LWNQLCIVIASICAKVANVASNVMADRNGRIAACSLVVMMTVRSFRWLRITTNMKQCSAIGWLFALTAVAYQACYEANVAMTRPVCNEMTQRVADTFFSSVEKLAVALGADANDISNSLADVKTMTVGELSAVALAKCAAHADLISGIFGVIVVIAYMVKQRVRSKVAAVAAMSAPVTDTCWNDRAHFGIADQRYAAVPASPPKQQFFIGEADEEVTEPEQSIVAAVADKAAPVTDTLSDDRTADQGCAAVPVTPPKQQFFIGEADAEDAELAANACADTYADLRTGVPSTHSSPKQQFFIGEDDDDDVQVIDAVAEDLACSNDTTVVEADAGGGAVSNLIAFHEKIISVPDAYESAFKCMSPESLTKTQGTLETYAPGTLARDEIWSPIGSCSGSPTNAAADADIAAGAGGNALISLCAPGKCMAEDVEQKPVVSPVRQRPPPLTEIV